MNAWTGSPTVLLVVPRWLKTLEGLWGYFWGAFYKSFLPVFGLTDLCIITSCRRVFLPEGKKT